ncbi:Uncharacterised protein [Burkholderia pseudomallei]|uniref:hypothetical protein n=1 Tax=Burkholderia pseudomallei TaxID=28450 RepID=UPI000F08D818|nr:hypothetical protein [Burkholderia pseudomallei]CAJ2944053.1 Uncharacterised protein [Burkholderia pseudomallei]VCC89650.1 Uncharacterised protein [Burkholderia pseudomallei]VCC93898.1 Uncharacterised protein [Burkholderia pseudomallei]VCD10481.1 Uncharacterised protein [Burkholderia pseudomallei]VCD20857.1 Uncharacterised protein [Burkholderia pseudomallei]
MKSSKISKTLICSLLAFSATAFSIHPVLAASPQGGKIATTIQAAQGQTDIAALFKKTNFQMDSAAEYGKVMQAIAANESAAVTYVQDSLLSATEVQTTHPIWSGVQNGDRLGVSWSGGDFQHQRIFVYEGNGNAGKWKKAEAADIPLKQGGAPSILNQTPLMPLMPQQQVRETSASAKSVADVVSVSLYRRVTGNIDIYTVKVGSRIQGIYGVGMTAPGWIQADGVGTDIVVFQVRASGTPGLFYSGVASATVIRE